VTHPDDDPLLDWNPDAPAPGAEPPEPTPKPIAWGRGAAEGTAGATAEVDGPVVAETEPRHRRGRRKRERDGVRSIVEWVAVIVGALVVALVVKTFLFQAFYIPSASMEPALEEGDRVLVNKLSYDLHDINRGDIVVFELPPDKVGPDGIKDLIKRVVGLPGEVIETRGGVVHIDGERLDEPYLAEGTLTDSPPIERQTVPEEHIFVMGDNRDNSADSRFANRGPIPVDTVVGRAFVQVWPPTDLGGL
jgi:signal peptidase I